MQSCGSQQRPALRFRLDCCLLRSETRSLGFGARCSALSYSLHAGNPLTAMCLERAGLHLHKDLPCNLKLVLVFVFGNQQVSKLLSKVQDCHLLVTASRDDEIEEGKGLVFIVTFFLLGRWLYIKAYGDCYFSVGTKSELDISESFMFASKCSMLICTLTIIYYYYYFPRFCLSPMEGSLWKRHWLGKLISGLTKWI